MEGGSVRNALEAFETPQKAAAFYREGISLFDSEREKWLDAAKKAVEIYDQTKGPHAFNILRSNAETIAAAGYNSTPLPDIRQRRDVPDDDGRIVADTLESAINYQTDCENFDRCIGTAVSSSYVAGWGVTRIDYRPETGQGMITWQHCPPRNVPWNTFRHGLARSWAEVPWVSFEHMLSEDDLAELAPELDLVRVAFGQELKGKENEKSVFRTAKCQEIWDRDNGALLWLVEGVDEPVALQPDPLGLPDFFPTPEPLRFLSQIDGLTPVVAYEIYRDQAEELEEVSKRILALIGVLKFRGFYAGDIPALAGLQEMNDGEFRALDGFAAAMATDLDKAIWTQPLQEVVVTIRELVMRREEIKQAIYEITGIADIMRGSTKATETLGAQQIKTQWGSLRIQEFQREIQRYCRDLFRIKAHIIATQFEPQVLAEITGKPLSPEQVQLMRDTAKRGLRVEIETDSTIRNDLTRVQQNYAMFMQATGQFITAAMPLAQVMPGAAPALVEIFSSFARSFRLGRQAEDALSQLAKQAQSLGPTPEQQAEQEAAKQLQKAVMVAEAEKTIAEAETAQVATVAAEQGLVAQAVETRNAATGQQQEGFVN